MFGNFSKVFCHSCYLLFGWFSTLAIYENRINFKIIHTHSRKKSLLFTHEKIQIESYQENVLNFFCFGFIFLIFLFNVCCCCHFPHTRANIQRISIVKKVFLNFSINTNILTHEAENLWVLFNVLFTSFWCVSIRW